MKKLKKLFNRGALIILIIFIEVAIIIASTIIFFIIEETQPFLAIAACVLLIVQIFIFFSIIYKQTDAEFKIPWIVLLLLLPIYGTLLYLIFGPKRIKKKDYELLAAADGTSAKFFVNRENFDCPEKYKRVFSYLDKTLELKGTTQNKVTYYKNGKHFYPALIEALKEAKEFIFIEFFIIETGQQWDKVHEILKQKAAEGVKVRLVYDDFGCAGKLKGNYYKILRKEGINAHKFNPLRPIVSGIYNNRNHRKIVVVDHKYAFTGGINLADEYSNISNIHPFGYWKDTMIRIEGPAISNLIKIFLSDFDLCQKKTSNYPKYLKYDYEKFDEGGIVYPFSHGPGPYFKERVGEDTLINLIDSAEKTLFISSPYLIPSEALLYSLRRAALRGVDVKFFLPGHPDKKIVFHMAQTYFPKLIQAGVHIMIFRPGFNHEKCVLADDKIAFVGTINFDFRSLVHHFECGAVLYDVPCLKDIREDFDSMVVQSEEVAPTFKLPKLRAIGCAFVKLFLPML